VAAWALLGDTPDKVFGLTAWLTNRGVGLLEEERRAGQLLEATDGGSTTACRARNLGAKQGSGAAVKALAGDWLTDAQMRSLGVRQQLT
jgi:hypothetical protein